MARWGWRVETSLAATFEDPRPPNDPNKPGLEMERYSEEALREYNRAAARSARCVGFRVRLLDRDGFEVAADTACFAHSASEDEVREFQTVAEDQTQTTTAKDEGFDSLTYKESKRVARADFEFLSRCDLCE